MNQQCLSFDISFLQANADIIKQNVLSDLHQHYSKFVRKQKKHSGIYTQHFNTKETIEKANNCQSTARNCTSFSTECHLPACEGLLF